jgi:hypothetical protein
VRFDHVISSRLIQKACGKKPESYFHKIGELPESFGQLPADLSISPIWCFVDNILIAAQNNACNSQNEGNEDQDSSEERKISEPFEDGRK